MGESSESCKSLGPDGRAPSPAGRDEQRRGRGKGEVEEEGNGMHSASEAPKGLQILSWCKVKFTKETCLVRSHNPIHFDKEQSGCLRQWIG